MHPTPPFNPCMPVSPKCGVIGLPTPNASTLIVPAHHVETVNDVYFGIVPWLLVLAALLIYSRRLRRFAGRVIYFAIVLKRP